jgi:hypothetical protein
MLLLAVSQRTVKEAFFFRPYRLEGEIVRVGMSQVLYQASVLKNTSTLLAPQGYSKIQACYPLMHNQTEGFLFFQRRSLV